MEIVEKVNVYVEYLAKVIMHAALKNSENWVNQLLPLIEYTVQRLDPKSEVSAGYRTLLAMYGEDLKGLGYKETEIPLLVAAMEQEGSTEEPLKMLS